MIMAQKKTKPRSRGKSNRGNVSHSNTMRSRTTGRSNNRAPTGVGNPPRRMSGQQLSAFDITSRNISTRTVTVRDIPSNYNVKAPMNSNVRSSFVSPIGKNATVINVLPQLNVMNSYGCPNYISPVVPNASVGNVLPPPHVMNSNGRSNFISPIGQYASVINVLPQPSGIVQALQQMSINENVQNATQPVLHKTEAKPYNDPEINKKYREHIKQLESLISSSCHVTVPTVKTVSFSPETKPKINTNSSVCVNSTPKSAPLAGIVPPKPKIKLSEDAERILAVAPPARKCNPIEDEQIKDEDLKEKKSPPKILKNTASPANNFKKLMDIYEEDIDDLDEAVPEFAAVSFIYEPVYMHVLFI